jgi:DNA-binding NtrC family response regulator
LLKAVEQGLEKGTQRKVVPPLLGQVLSPTPEPIPITVLVPAPVLESGPKSLQDFALDKPLREARDEFEKAYFEYHLAQENGSMTRVAEKTGLERTHLYRKLKQLGVDLTRGKRSAS